MSLKVETSLILDQLIENLKHVTLDEDIEKTTFSFKKSFSSPSWDFAGYKEYTPGDDAKKIDWKASLRTKKTLIKEYAEIQTLNVIFLLDISESMTLGTREKRKCDFAAEVIATLSYSILKAKGEVKLALFNEMLITPITVINELSQFSQITKQLLKEEIKGGQADLQTAVNLLRPHLKKGTFLFLISDFLNLKDDWEESIYALSSQVFLIGVMIRDIIDHTLPSRIYKVVIGKPSSPDRFIFNVHKYKKKYEQAAREQEQEVQNLFHKSGADIFRLENNEPYLNLCIDWLKRRR